MNHIYLVDAEEKNLGKTGNAILLCRHLMKPRAMSFNPIMKLRVLIYAYISDSFI